MAWSAVVVGLLALLAVAFAVDWVFQMSRLERAVAMIVHLLVAVWGYLRYARPWLLQSESESEIALLLERRHRLDGGLVAAMQFESAEAVSWGSSELRQAVIQQAARNVPALDETPWESPLGLRRRLGWAAVAVALWTILILSFPSHVEVFFRRLVLDAKHYPARTRLVEIVVNGRVVDPKMRKSVRMAVRHHTPVVFEVTCAGAVPCEGHVHVIGAEGTRTTLAAVAVEDHPERFRAELPQAYEPIYYQLFFGDAWTDPAPLGITVPPTIDVEMEVTPPAYAGGREKSPERAPTNLRQLAVLEGSRVRLAIRSDKPLTGAAFTVGGKPPESLVQSADSSSKQWNLPEKGLLEAVVEPIAYTIQVTDTEGGQLDAPLTGMIRVEPDVPPKVTLAVATHLVLPQAKPVVHYRAMDDCGLVSITAICEVAHADGTVVEDEIMLYRLGKGQPLRRDVEGDYPMVLTKMRLSKGDRIRLTLRAVDYRAPREGKPAQSEPVLFEVTDKPGILAAMTETNRRSAEILDTMIRRQLRLGEGGGL